MKLRKKPVMVHVGKDDNGVITRRDVMDKLKGCPVDFQVHEPCHPPGPEETYDIALEQAFRGDFNPHDINTKLSNALLIDVTQEQLDEIKRVAWGENPDFAIVAIMAPEEGDAVNDDGAIGG